MNIQDVENLAELAKIELTAAEKEQLLKDMEGILAYVAQINDVEVEDSAADFEQKNVWREDVAEPREFSRELILEQFPDKHEGFLKVKKIL